MGNAPYVCLKNIKYAYSYFEERCEKDDFMAIKIEDFLRKILLPKRYLNDNFDICQKYKDETDEYLKFLGMIDGSEFEEYKRDKIQQRLNGARAEIEENINSIISVFNYYEGANPKAAQEEMDIMMERMKTDLFVASIDDWVKVSVSGASFWTQFRITPRRQFYRVRAVEEETTDIQNNPDELFHIPLSKKAFTNNERFSLAGFPSLYLSSMLPLAWQECGYPKKYYYSEFQYEKLCRSMSERQIENELKFLALYSPDEIYKWGISTKYNKFDLWLEVIIRYIKQFPLILACAFVNHSGKVSYKQEYIVPQMLMQWVQRNNAVIQGISYFTCVDLTMFNSRWCAYNIVIPAFAPYDKNKYSKKLREDFGWSRPRFYEVPLVDSANNKSDRECLYAFIEKIKENFRMLNFPEQYINYLLEILDLCCCLYNILETSKTMDMQLALHIMNLIDRAYSRINKSRANVLISEVNQKKDNLSELEKSSFNSANIEFQNIVQEFTDDNRDGSGIKFIIDKYRGTIWNDLNCSSKVAILYIDKNKLGDEIAWLHENHFLYFLKELKSDDQTVDYLKKICKEAEIDLEALWGVPVKGDVWMKEHMADIKTPIFVRTNDISIYSEDNAKMYDYIQVGFDKCKLKENLLK